MSASFVRAATVTPFGRIEGSSAVSLILPWARPASVVLQAAAFVTSGSSISGL